MSSSGGLEALRERYLSLLERSLCGVIDDDPSIYPWDDDRTFRPERREEGFGLAGAGAEHDRLASHAQPARLYRNRLARRRPRRPHRNRRVARRCDHHECAPSEAIVPVDWMGVYWRKS
jgi:hypothetical protein